MEIQIIIWIVAGLKFEVSYHKYEARQDKRI
jgi:hypothetical protein